MVEDSGSNGGGQEEEIDVLACIEQIAAERLRKNEKLMRWMRGEPGAL